MNQLYLLITVFDKTFFLLLCNQLHCLAENWVNKPMSLGTTHLYSNIAVLADFVLGNVGNLCPVC